MKAETEAFHLGGSLGSVEVDGGFANVAGNSCEEKEKSREPFVPHVANMSKKKEHEHNVAGSQFNLYNKSFVGLNSIMAFECLRQYFVTKALPDLNDAIQSFPGWKRAFGEALYGLIFLIILVKQPTPRRLIVTSFRKNLQMKCISERMYNAYVDAIWTVAEDPESFWPKSML